MSSIRGLQIVRATKEYRSVFVDYAKQKCNLWDTTKKSKPKVITGSKIRGVWIKK